MPKLLHRQVFTHRGIYTKVLHTDAADASTHRSFWTQMPFHTEAFTQRGFDIYTPMHTEAFRHRWFFRESQKLWHREAFTQRIFYTQKLLHTQAFPQKLLHREAFEHELLHTDVFTNRRLVHTGLLRTEAFTQRSLYTQTLSHRKTDSTEQLLHTSKSRNFTFLTFGHHIVRRGCIRRWKIAILDVGQSFCVKWVAPDLVKSHFYTSFISRETVVPDDPKWIKSQFYTNSWTFASDVKKSSVFPQLLPFSFHATLASELSKYTSFWWLTLISCEGAGPGPAKFAFCHVFDVRPARSLSPQTVAAGPRTNKTRISPHVWVSDTPQRVTFRKPPPGCRCRQREIEELEKSDFAGVHIQFDHWKLAELLCSNSCATISVQMTLQAGLL